MFRGVTIGNNVNASLRGYPALGLATINEFGLGGLTGRTSGLTNLVRSQYGGDLTVEKTGTRALAAAAQVGTLSGSTAADETTRAFADLAVLLDADLGVEVASVNTGGWDTHNNMGTAAAGEMRSTARGTRRVPRHVPGRSRRARPRERDHRRHDRVRPTRRARTDPAAPTTASDA